jgi:hypothetical protein
MPLVLHVEASDPDLEKLLKYVNEEFPNLITAFRVILLKTAAQWMERSDSFSYQTTKNRAISANLEVTNEKYVSSLNKSPVQTSEYSRSDAAQDELSSQ